MADSSALSPEFLLNAKVPHADLITVGWDKKSTEQDTFIYQFVGEGEKLDAEEQTENIWYNC